MTCLTKSLLIQWADCGAIYYDKQQDFGHCSDQPRLTEADRIGKGRQHVLPQYSWTTPIPANILKTGAQNSGLHSFLEASLKVLQHTHSLFYFFMQSSKVQGQVCMVSKSLNVKLNTQDYHLFTQSAIWWKHFPLSPFAFNPSETLDWFCLAVPNHPYYCWWTSMFNLILLRIYQEIRKEAAWPPSLQLGGSHLNKCKIHTRYKECTLNSSFSSI